MQRPLPHKTQVEIISAIRKSAASTRLLRISYVDAKGVESLRSVEPYEIKENSLYAFCHKANAIRRFNLNQIIQAQPTRTKFIPKYTVLIT
jgi:predicted DNA-binding transcriptional regulator YafY